MPSAGPLRSGDLDHLRHARTLFNHLPREQRRLLSAACVMPAAEPRPPAHELLERYSRREPEPFVSFERRGRGGACGSDRGHADPRAAAGEHGPRDGQPRHAAEYRRRRPAPHRRPDRARPPAAVSTLLAAPRRARGRRGRLRRRNRPRRAGAGRRPAVGRCRAAAEAGRARSCARSTASSSSICCTGRGARDRAGGSPGSSSGSGRALPAPSPWWCRAACRSAASGSSGWWRSSQAIASGRSWRLQSGV